MSASSEPDLHLTLYHESKDFNLSFHNVAANDTTRKLLDKLEEDWTNNAQKDSDTHGVSSAPDSTSWKLIWLVSKVSSLSRMEKLSIDCHVRAHLRSKVHSSTKGKARREASRMKELAESYDWKEAYAEWLEEMTMPSKTVATESTVLASFQSMLSEQFVPKLCDKEAAEGGDVYLRHQRLIQ